ncbi:MAG TPA: phosphatase PAP2 family protein [Kribbella sp.]|nr:phosphatase PAP2 family protein [Kribbella sp.]
MAPVTLEPVSRTLDEPPLPASSSGGSRTGRILREVALLAFLFLVYNAGRFMSAKHAGAAFTHADELIHLQTQLGLPSETDVQHAALRIPHLAQAANRYYAAVHFPLTALVLAWLLIRRPAAYPRARWSMAALTGLALIGHLIFPLAPPRMLPQDGWVDTGVLLGQSVYGPTTDSGVANQFAAMPSLHVGWALMVAVFLIRHTSSRWRWLWIAHPVITFAVVVVTANHYWLDGLIATALAAPLLLLLRTSPARRRYGSSSRPPAAAPLPK